jgi:hypothetical protein
MTSRFALSFAVAAVVLASACSSRHDAMGPGMMGSGSVDGNGVRFMSVSPTPGATGVPVGSPIELRFGGPMAPAMEQYLDLHRGDLSGPVVPMGCTWKSDRTILTCTPSEPLASHTTYAIHLGGGMMGGNGVPIDYSSGLRMGGQWIMGSMMSGSHGGMGWGMMGGSWRNANGSYGMVFTFTTEQ